jgi:hypothetical protein
MEHHSVNSLKSQEALTPQLERHHSFQSQPKSNEHDAIESLGFEFLEECLITENIEALTDAKKKGANISMKEVYNACS